MFRRFFDAPQWLLTLLAAFVIGNLFGLVFFPPHTDEAYYWMLSQRPGLSYFDHPPLVPWMMAVFTSLFGNALWALRLPAAIAWFVTAWVVFMLAIELADDRRAGWVTLLVFSSLPIFQAAFHVVGPDSGLMLSTSLTYYLAARAVRDRSPAFWLLAGAATGAGMLAKYNMVLVPAAIFIALLANRDARNELRKPWPWIAGFLALLLFSPVLVWNYQHEWASFAFQWRHGTGTDTASWLQNLGFYLVNQFGVISPWGFVAMLVAAIRTHRYVTTNSSYTLTLVSCGFWLPLVFFGLTGLLTKGHASWPAMAYIPGTILLGLALNRWLTANADSATKDRRWVTVTVIMLALFSLIAANLFRFPLQAAALGIGPLPNSHASNGMGWHTVAQELVKLRTQESRRRALDRPCRIIALPGFDNNGFPYYLTAAEIGLQLEDAQAVTTAPGGRLTQFDFWREQETTAPAPCIAVTGPYTSKEMPPRIDNGTDAWQQHKVIGIKMPAGSFRWYGIYLRRDS